VKRCLLDTNVVSELRKPEPQDGAIAWIKSLEQQRLILWAVTRGEFQQGIEKLKLHGPAKACLTPDQLIEDAMIAATARVHGLTVATRNTKDFVNLGVQVLNPFSM
jgi:toxin FitB